MYSSCVIGASGYTGAELIKILWSHPNICLDACYVSHNSADAHKSIRDVHGQLSHISSVELLPIDSKSMPQIGTAHDLVFLALPHEVSHEWAQALSHTNTMVFDLSGAYRLKDTAVFEQYYGFTHQHPDLLNKAAYGLAEWYADEIENAAGMVAVAGCYPTASLLALKPLTQNNLLCNASTPVINATSGVSGAGKKANQNNIFTEVSLQAYGVHEHRHTPEIQAYSGTNVIFTPHLGAYKRGILATITAFVKQGITASEIHQAYADAYADKPLVRLTNNWPKIDDVAHSPYCDIHWSFNTENRCLIVCSAIDNLLKGAASQAVQCANMHLKLPETTGLV